MIRSIVNLIVNYLSNNKNYNNEQKEKMEYILTIMIYELIKFILLIFILYLLGFLKEGLVVLIAIMITKPFIGGYHEDSQIKCFSATLIIVCSLIILGENVQLNIVSILILNLFSIFCVYHKAPIINEKMPLTKEKLIIRNKAIGVSNSFIFLTLSIIMFKVRWFSQIIVWTSVVQTMLLFNKYKKVYGGR